MAKFSFLKLLPPYIVMALSMSPGLASSIGDFMWKDSNQNGIQGAGEPGVAGVMVSLYSCVGTLIASTNTDANGQYLFDNLGVGDYFVEFIAPSGYDFTMQDQGVNDAWDSDAGTTGKTVCTTLDAGENDRTWDAGLIISSSSIGDFVWNDVNRNGIQDTGEPGMAGVTVNLYSCPDIMTGTKTTDASGNYLFDNLGFGDYFVEFIAPSGYDFTMQDQGSDEALDSDAATTGRTVCTTLGPGENDMTWEAGLINLKSSKQKSNKKGRKTKPKRG